MREEIEKILARLAPTAEESSHITGSEPFYAIKESDLPEFIDQILTLLDKEVRKAVEKIAQESTVNFFGIQEGSDISTKKKWVQVIKTQDILEQLEKEGK